MDCILQTVFAANNLPLTEEQGKCFTSLTEKMLRVNEKMNLTAVTRPEEIAVKHYVDCAAMASLPPQGATVCDIGAGAGFPTLPLGILRPDLRITAVDSTEKRMRYVSETGFELGLKNLSVLTARAEEMGKNSVYRETFDVVTARAVAPLNVLCELCLPLLRMGGIFCALKAAGGREEWENAQNAAAILGAKLKEIREFSLVDPSEGLAPDSLKRMILVFEKVSPTPEKYPRRYPKIQSKPL